jgi:hypothetical protein
MKIMNRAEIGELWVWKPTRSARTNDIYYALVVGKSSYDPDNYIVLWLDDWRTTEGSLEHPGFEKLEI